MANENKKDFNAMMNNNKDMPKIIEIKGEESIKKWGGTSMVIAPPIAYDEVMKLVPYGKLITTTEIRKHMANKYHVEVGCPLTAGIFINICAWASSQRSENITPYWRTLKKDGELNEKYPGGILSQKNHLESEHHQIITKGKKNIKYYVKDYNKSIFNIE